MEKKYLELIEYLRLIPTGDNAQQFRFIIFGGALKIIHDHKIAQHEFNQNNTASLISLGMMIEVVENYAAKNLLTLDYKLPTDFNNTEVWLEIYLNANDMSSSVHQPQSTYYLYNLKNRMTYRAPFKSKNVDIQSLKEKFKTEVIIKKSISFSFLTTLLKTEGIILNHQGAFEDITKWIRFSESEVQKTKTGMSLPNLFIDPLSGFFIKLACRSKLLAFFIKNAFKFFNLFKIYLLFPLNSHFILIPIQGKSDLDIIKAGKAILSSWLTLTECGLVAQPISSASMLSFSHEMRNASFDKKTNQILKDAFHAISKEFNLKNKYGFWLMRFGYPYKQFTLPRYKTLRQDVNESTLSLQNEAARVPANPRVKKLAQLGSA